MSKGTIIYTVANRLQLLESLVLAEAASRRALMFCALKSVWATRNVGIGGSLRMCWDRDNPGRNDTCLYLTILVGLGTSVALLGTMRDA